MVILLLESLKNSLTLKIRIPKVRRAGKSDRSHTNEQAHETSDLEQPNNVPVMGRSQ